LPAAVVPVADWLRGGGRLRGGRLPAARGAPRGRAPATFPGACASVC